MNSYPMVLSILGALLCCSPIVSAAYTLITFDVDGTLVKGSGKAADASAHSRAYGVACGRVFGDGRTPTRPVADVLPRTDYHGSTDGLILLRLARAEMGVEPSESAPRLDELMGVMYEYIGGLGDDEVANGISILPGVIDRLETLGTMKDRVACGLVTGNVEGIARRKMRAVGVWQTGALAPPAGDQTERRWPGSDEVGFLGGFGSDFCSGDIDDPTRNYLDRSEQIAIATKRCQDSLLSSGDRLRRVVHVGDAPSDVLAAKAFSQRKDLDLCVGCVAVATGSYGADELKELAGEPIPGKWEPVTLEEGMADPDFIKACGVE